MTEQELLDKIEKVFEGIPEHVSATVGDIKKTFRALLTRDEPERETEAELESEQARAPLGLYPYGGVPPIEGARGSDAGITEPDAQAADRQPIAAQAAEAASLEAQHDA